MRFLSIPGNEIEKIIQGYALEITYDDYRNIVLKEHFNLDVLKNTTLGALSCGMVMKPIEITNLEDLMMNTLINIVSGGDYVSLGPSKRHLLREENRDIVTLIQNASNKGNVEGNRYFKLDINEPMKEYIMEHRNNLSYLAQWICYQAMDDI
jgi:hypothetical protein